MFKKTIENIPASVLVFALLYVVMVELKPDLFSGLNEPISDLLWGSLIFITLFDLVITVHNFVVRSRDRLNRNGKAD